MAVDDLKPVLSQYRTYLGRPWKQYSRTVYLQTYLDTLLDPAGWLEWDGDFTLDTLYYGEYIWATVIWVASGHHAAVNFGQYMYGGYFPSIPTISRSNMPNESPGYGDIQDVDFYKFVTKPEDVLLKCFPSQVQATQVMSILDVLSNHSPDEEYIGQCPEPSWAEDPTINATFVRFQGKLKEMEGVFDERNSNPQNKNRVGAGVVPYELLKPISKPGVTGIGVPNSKSI